jgi:hypothetical protein
VGLHRHEPEPAQPGGGAVLHKRGTGEQWIKEGKQAVKMTRLSCHRFLAKKCACQLSLLAYNLANLWRRLVLPKKIENWSLIQFTATVGEDRRQADQARSVLLASVGRGPSDAAGVRGDSAADLGAAVTGGVRAGGLPGRKGSEEKKEGYWSVRELRRNAPKLPVGSRLEGASPTSHEYCYSFRRRAAKNLVAIEAIAIYWETTKMKLGSQNGNPELLKKH